MLSDRICSSQALYCDVIRAFSCDVTHFSHKDHYCDVIRLFYCDVTGVIL